MHTRQIRAAMAAGALSLAGLAAAAGHAAPAGAAARVAPPGYTVIDTNEMTAQNGTKTRGEAHCPTGTVPLGGGVVVSSTSTLANVAASFPDGRVWIGDVTNASGADTTFQIEVVCAKRPSGYTVRESAGTLNPSGLQSSAVATCPTGTKPLGGGGTSTSSGNFVNMNSTGPQGQNWTVTENNASGFDEGLTAFAVCGKVKGYRVATGRAFASPGNGQGAGTAACPAPDVAIGGGVFSASPSVGVNLGGTVPMEGRVRWQAFVNDASAVAVTASAVVTCATG